jgi:hypothetical protein
MRQGGGQGTLEGLGPCVQGAKELGKGPECHRQARFEKQAFGAGCSCAHV